MSNDIIRVVGVGRLTRDPELREIPGGTKLCEASIACNSSKKRGSEWEEYCSFFSVTVFGSQAEALVKYGKKGHRIGVDGRLIQRRWKAQDESGRERVQITADRIQFLQGTEGKRATRAPDSEPVPDDGVPF